MVPHATGGAERRRSSSARPNAGKFKFPDLSLDHVPAFDEEELEDIATPRPLPNGLPTGLHSSERWPGRRSTSRGAWPSARTNGTRQGRQKSLSEAISLVRGRKASISENAVEIAEALKAPVSVKLILLCCVWYTTSLLTNTSSKVILTALPRPVTLTIVQFALVSFWCLFLSWLAKHNRTIRERLPILKDGVRKPSKEILAATLPLTAFQIGGHILNSDAMSRISVSLVHTIKGLSPLMTVIAYRVFYDIRYSTATYLSLIPLTVGVILACSASFRGNLVGLTYAFGSAILFVTQNIVSKKIFNEAAKAEADGTPVARRKPDKLNLLCYSSAMAFLITCPIWLWSEGFSIAADYFQDGSIDLRQRPGSLDHGRLAVEFIFNGTFHFGQSLVAFVLLGIVSPVTYSVASLIKRVVVIIFAILWFGNPMTRIQGFGFALTFAGLYLYDRMSDATKADRKAREQAENSEPLLPLNTGDAKKHDAAPALSHATYSQSPIGTGDFVRPFAGASGYAIGGDAGGSGPGRPRGRSTATPPNPNATPFALPAGTKAEETWRGADAGRQQAVGVR